MSGVRVLAAALVIALVFVTGLFAFVPSARPGIVRSWLRQARGFGPAKSPDDALDKFRKALAARDYETASTFCAGDYREWLEKTGPDALALGKEVDNLRVVLQDHGVKSDKADFVLFKLDPFPAGFKVEAVQKVGQDRATALLSWKEDLYKHAAQKSLVQDWQVNNLIYCSLLPDDTLTDLLVELKAEGAGDKRTWKILFPVQRGATRHLRDSVNFLQKNGTNVRNALDALKTDVKTDPSSREKLGCENALRSKLEDATK